MLIVLESILWVIRFFFGACIFSFLNVVIDRLPRAESGKRKKSLYELWQSITCVGTDPVCQLHIPARTMCRL